MESPSRDTADDKARSFSGKASFYSHPGKVASGGNFDPKKLTAAHRTLPFGTRVRVFNRRNGRTIVVVINDRGPYVPGRVLDLSLSTARKLGMEEKGVIRVTAEVL